MAKSPNWTIDELDILRTVYPEEGCSSNLLSKLPGRNPKGISIKASRIGIKVLNPWNKLLNTEEYNEKIIKYNICAVSDYINDRTEILHVCLKCNTEWLVRPNNIVNGHGCPSCRKGYGFSPNTSVDIASIYLIEIKLFNKEHFLKIGITSNPTNLRFVNIKSDIGSDNVDIFNIILREYSTGTSIASIESKVLCDSTLKRYISSIHFPGYTELFQYSEKDKIINIIINSLSNEAPKFIA